MKSSLMTKLNTEEIKIVSIKRNSNDDCSFILNFESKNGFCILKYLTTGGNNCYHHKTRMGSLHLYLRNDKSYLFSDVYIECHSNKCNAGQILKKKKNHPFKLDKSRTLYIWFVYLSLYY